MTTEIETTPTGIAIVHLAGEMDLYSSNDFKNQIAQTWATGVRRLVVDLSNLEYLDSSGVGTLLHIYSASQKRGTVVMFAGARGIVMKVIELTRLDGFLPMSDSVALATAALADGEGDAGHERDVRPQEEILVDDSSPLLDTRGLYHKEFHISRGQVPRLATLIAQRAPAALTGLATLERRIHDLLDNAVHHGNRDDARKALGIWFRYTDGDLRLIIEDEGRGFRTIDAWNQFYQRRMDAYRSRDFERMMSFLAFRSDYSAADDRGVALMEAIEYWNGGIVFASSRRRVGVQRRYAAPPDSHADVRA